MGEREFSTIILRIKRSIVEVCAMKKANLLFR